MSLARPLILAVALAGAPGAIAQSFPAQQIQMVPRATPDADALADAMRRLGANPRDLASLIEAGELSLRLGDVNAAASLLKRAEIVDPMNGRVKAGMARILVTQERPGEALRYFDQAVGYGLSPATFAGDRGLAYDLIGEQERAQRDYRVALKSAVGDEVRRRYALSLGISGKRKEALAEIDDQVRDNDRSAWRVRAFILAMTGDVPGAEKIAKTMMPPGMGTALAPFFARLAALPPADRAFAVHFGELRPTPQRLADARRVPALPVLAPEAPQPVQVAAAPPPAKAPDSRNDRRRAREEARRQRDLARAEQRARRSGKAVKPPVVVASVAPARTTVSESDGFQPPRYAGVAFAPPKAVVQAVPAQASAATPPAASVATAASTPSPTPTPTPTLPATQLAAVTPRPLPAPPAAASSMVAQPGFSSSDAAPMPRMPAPPPVASAPAISEPLPTVPAPAPAPIAAATSASPPAAAPAPAPAPVAASSAVAEVVTPVSPAASEDTILARIMAGISIPGEELGVAPVRPPEPAPTPQPAAAPGTSVATPASIASAEAARRAAETVRETQQAAAAEAEAKSTPAKLEKVVKKAAADRNKSAAEAEKPAIDPKKAAADRKAAAAKKLADAKKVAEAKKAAEEAKAAKADPSRIWVQVAGGANKSDLPKAWAAAQNKAAALKGKSAYTTPLRFTNRVVTGPFKTDAEAREFINTLAKQGISAFSFTSDKGQKMERLPAK